MQIHKPWQKISNSSENQVMMLLKGFTLKQLQEMQFKLCLKKKKLKVFGC